MTTSASITRAWLRLRRAFLLPCWLLLLCQAGLLQAQSSTPPVAPATWWAEAGLLNSNAANNSGVVVIGQLKNVVSSLAKLLDIRYTAQGGCGDDLRAAVRSWDRNFPATASAAFHTPDIVQDGAMLAVANQGQLKNLALLTYRRLKALGIPIVLKDRHVVTHEVTAFIVDPDNSQQHPWNSGKNRLALQLGQLKYCFSFELPFRLAGAGRVVAWGANTSGQSTVPAGLEDAVAVAAGAHHNLALKSNGQVVAWGDNYEGQATVPAGLSNVVAIAAGASHSLAVKNDGTVVAWGSSQAGKTNVPAGLTGVVAVSAGFFHSLALKSDGTVVAWGAVNYGGSYYYNISRADYGQARVPAGLTGVVAIAAGLYHSLALKSDGTVVAWGASSDPNQYQYSYQSSPTTYVNRFPDNYDRGQVTVPAGLRATAISANYLTSIAVRTDGTLVAWGANASASMPAGPAHVVKAAAFQGYEYSGAGYGTVLLNDDGTVTAWDNAGAAKTDVPTGLAGVTAVAVGDSHALAIVRQPSSPGVPAPVWVSAAASFGAEEASIAGTYYRSQVMYGPATYTATGLPPGLAIDSTTGVVSGTPTTAGTYDAVITATNAAGLQAQNVRFSLGHLLPQVLTTELQPATILNAYSETLSFQQVLDSTITATQVTGLPPGLSYDASSQTISGTTTQVGTSEIGVTVESALGSSSRTLSLSVGTIATWGSNSAGRTALPVGLSQVVAVSLGTTHSLALKSDGTVVAWGGNVFGQRVVPAGLNGVAAISAGSYHSMALKSDGTVVAWGTNSYNQCDVPAGLGDVVAIAAGDTHNLALKSDGTVVGWGSGGAGAATIPVGLSGVVGIAAGTFHSMALKSDGTVVTWGLNNYDQLPVPAGLGGVVAISAGWGHSLALKSDGTVVAWGSDLDGQVTVPTGLTDVVAIETGLYHNLALRSNGSVVAWGRNTDGQTTGAAGLASVTVIAAGGNHSAALVSSATSFASSAYFQQPAGPNPGVSGEFYRSSVLNGPASFSATGLPPGLSIDSATGVVSGSLDAPVGDWTATLIATGPAGVATRQVTFRFTDLLPQIDSTSGDSAPVFQAYSRSLIMRQATSTDVAGLPPGISYDPATQMLTGTPVQTGTYQLTATATNSVGTRTWPIELVVRNIFGWGYNAAGQKTPPGGLAAATAISAGESHSLALKADGTVVAWGDDDYAQTDMPAGLTGIVAIAAGARHNLVLKDDGTLAAWGQNTSNKATVPAGLTGVVAIDAGGGQNLALRSNGRVYPWGQITALPYGYAFAAVGTGSAHNLALTIDGTVVAWGADAFGRTAVPGGLTGVVAIAAGLNHSLALRNDGTVVAWGSDSNGQVTVPAGLSGVVAISAGNTHSLALKGDGTVVAWGDNGSGQSLVPAGLQRVTAISAGGRFNLVLLAPDSKPVFISPSRSTGPEDGSSATGIYYRARVVNGPATFTATGLPPGLVLDSATGIVSGTPTTPPYSAAVYPPGYPSGYDTTVTVGVPTTFTATTSAGSATHVVKFYYPTTVHIRAE